MPKINMKTLILILGLAVVLIYIFFIKDNNFELEKQTEEIVIEDEKSEKNEENEKNEEKEGRKKELNSKKIIVYVVGAVKNEGIYELDENSRIADAIEEAGGLEDNAYIKNINLAYVLSDGMKIYIPAEDEKEKEIVDYTDNYVYEEDTDFNIKNTNKNDIKVNINNATQTELETLPGIGPSIALSIIEYRNNNGKFNNIEDIKNVSGIGENKFIKIKNLIVI